MLDLALARPPGAGRTRVVALDGPSGAGKTTLAEALAVRARLRPEVTGGVALMAMDEIHPGWDGLAASVPLLVAQVLEPLAHGRPAAYRRWDWDAGRPGDLVALPRADLLVVEGAGCGSRAARRYLSALVWVEAPAPVRRTRALARDGGAYAPHWERWAAQEEALFAAERTRERADLVLTTG